MFEFRIEGAYDAEKLLTANWPTCVVTVIQRGAEWKSWGPNHLVVPMSDVGDPKASPDAPTIQHLAAILAHTANLTSADRLMVNCWLGQSRSSAVAVAILMQHGMTTEEAFEAVLEQRPVAVPNVLICRHIDSYFGTKDCEAMAKAHLKNELASIKKAPDGKPTAKEVDDMKKWLANL